jgi:hypothetical protein
VKFDKKTIAVILSTLLSVLQNTGVVPTAVGPTCPPERAGTTTME